MDEIGVLVNPIAGMGGRVGLKGTDGKVEEARRLGGTPRSPDRAKRTLKELHRHQPDLKILTAGGMMGETVVDAVGYDPIVVYEPGSDRTSAADTKSTVRAFVEAGVDLILFAGGDGTAVDIANALESVDSSIPILGIPAGVKVFSSVFAVTPEDAGRIVSTFDRCELREVNDIDESAYREGTVRTALRAVVHTPVADTMQSSKQLIGGAVGSLATGYARTIRPETTYVFGPGSSVGAIEAELDIDYTPLGVDVWRDGTTLEVDVDESTLLDLLEPPSIVVVSPIGGQGFVFGRGNQQISPKVIERVDDIEIVATEEKLDELDVLRVDTGNPDVDESLRGWVRVHTGQFTSRYIEIV